MATRTRTRRNETDVNEQPTENEPTETENEPTENTEQEAEMVENTETEPAAVATAPTETKPAKPEPISPITPFQAAKRVNAALKAAGLNKKIQAPMLYTYAGKDKFKTHPAKKVTAKGIEKVVLEIDEESFVLWMTENVNGVVARATGVRPTQKPAEVDVAEGEEASGITTDETADETEDAVVEAE